MQLTNVLRCTENCNKYVIKIVHSNLVCFVLGGIKSLNETLPHRMPRSVGKYTCKICMTTFADSQTLLHHYKYDEKRKYCEMCNQCDKVFFVPATYKYHLQAKHKVPMNLPECEVCGKCFQDNYNLNRHMVVHTGERPYQCTRCFKTFKLKDNAKSHSRFCRGYSETKDSGDFPELQLKLFTDK
jgi:uncharacterized Zn-finger protein